MKATKTKVEFYPHGDRVLIAREEVATMTPGGIHLPEQAKRRPRRGTVLAVGPGRVLDNGEVTPVALEVGETVMFDEYAGVEIELGGAKYLLVSEENVLGTVSP